MVEELTLMGDQELSVMDWKSQVIGKIRNAGMGGYE